MASVSMPGQCHVTLEEQTYPTTVGFVACQRSEGPVSAGVKMKTMTPRIYGANLTFAAHLDSHFPPENTDVLIIGRSCVQGSRVAAVTEGAKLAKKDRN